jgi:hypothetical protein
MYIVKYQTDDLNCYNYYWLCSCCNRLNYMDEFSNYKNYYHELTNNNLIFYCGQNEFIFDVSVFPEFVHNDVKYECKENNHKCNNRFELNVRQTFYNCDAISFDEIKELVGEKTFDKLCYYSSYANWTFFMFAPGR